MRVLLVLPEAPVPFGGAAARWFHVVLEELRCRGVATTAIIASSRVDDELEAQTRHGDHADLRFYPPDSKNLLSPVASLLRPYSYPYSKAMAAAVEQELQQAYDVVRFETHFTAWLTRNPAPHAELNVHQLYRIDTPTCAVKSQRARLLHSRVLRAEATLLRRFQRVSSLTQRLSTEVGRVHPLAARRVTPMTIDPKLYPCKPRHRRQGEPPTIGLIGTFRWGPTHTAARRLIDEVWPAVRRELPDVRLLLVGRGASEAFGRLGDQPNVEVHSDVPDTLPYFRRLDTLVYLPDVGSGMKVKVLEAIALGTPVVTNLEGAEGLPENVAMSITATEVQQAIEKVTSRVASCCSSGNEASLRDMLLESLSPYACVETLLAHGPPELVRPDYNPFRTDLQ